MGFTPRGRCLSGLFLLFSAFLISFSRAEQPDKEHPEVQEILRSGSAFRTSMHLSKLFARLDSEGIRQLKTHANHGIALHAAWQEIRRTVGPKDSDQGRPVDPVHLQRFLGYLEGRLQISVPVWWEKIFLTAFPNRGDFITFRFEKLEHYGLAGENFLAPKGTSVARRDRNLLLTVKEGSVLLPTEVVEAARALGIEEGDAKEYQLSALVAPERAYVVVHGGLSMWCGTLYCIDRKSSKVVWTADIWAWGMSGGTSGFLPLAQHQVALHLRNGQIVVLGIDSMCAYVEGFNAQDGKNEFRFNTSVHRQTNQK